MTEPKLIDPRKLYHTEEFPKTRPGYTSITKRNATSS